MERKIIQIGDTPLSYSVFSVESSPTKMADLFVNKFNIVFYHYGSENMPKQSIEKAHKCRCCNCH